jgi:hypothetical protein
MCKRGSEVQPIAVQLQGSYKETGNAAGSHPPEPPLSKLCRFTRRAANVRSNIARCKA